MRVKCEGEKKGEGMCGKESETKTEKRDEEYGKWESETMTVRKRGGG